MNETVKGSAGAVERICRSENPARSQRAAFHRPRHHPPGRQRRFDARFFTLDASAIAHRVEGVTGPDAELVELVWMPLTDAKQLDMPAVTGVMLEELDARIADGFGHDLPVPFYSMPRGRFKRDLL